MDRAVIYDCLPWLALLFVSGAGLWLVVRLNEGRFAWRRLLSLHRNEVGSAQSLSFVLTLPFFVVIVLFIVQISQLMIGTMIVHYAAFAAARAAVVWIPAGIGPRDNWIVPQNCVGGMGYVPDASAPDNVLPDLLQPTSGGMTYQVIPGGPKYDKIRSAAWLACLPICPSRNLGLGLPPGGATAQAALKDVYRTLAGATPTDARWQNKLAYAMLYTGVDIRFYHDNAAALEPPLVQWWIRHDGSPSTGVDDDEGVLDFREGQEVGWQDPITVTVTHHMALLPGPGRILANKVGFVKTSADGFQQDIEGDTLAAQPPSNVYVYTLTASCTLGNEGEKSVLPYEYLLY